jgi:hypothetical protein
MKKKLNNGTVKLILALAFFVGAVLFLITGFMDTVKSDGWLFASAMLALPLAGCVSLTIMAIRGW